MTPHPVTIETDAEADAAYFRISDGLVKSTLPVGPEIMVDIDSKDEVVGIELLSLKAHIPYTTLKERFGVAASVVSELRTLSATIGTADH